MNFDPFVPQATGWEEVLFGTSEGKNEVYVQQVFHMEQVRGYPLVKASSTIGSLWLCFHHFMETHRSTETMMCSCVPLWRISDQRGSLFTCLVSSFLPKRGERVATKSGAQVDDRGLRHLISETATLHIYSRGSELSRTSLEIILEVGILERSQQRSHQTRLLSI